MISRFFLLVVVVVAVSGCAGPESTYKPSGKPAMTLQIRRATSQPIEGWKAFETDQGGGHRTIYVSPDVVVSNRDLASTGVRRDENGLWALAIKLKERPARRFASLTGEMAATGASNPNASEELFAVFVDDELRGTPVVFERIDNGIFNLMGAFSHAENESEARRIARGLVQSE